MHISGSYSSDIATMEGFIQLAGLAGGTEHQHSSLGTHNSDSASQCSSEWLDQLKDDIDEIKDKPKVQKPSVATKRGPDPKSSTLGRGGLAKPAKSPGMFKKSGGQLKTKNPGPTRGGAAVSFTPLFVDGNDI